VIEETAIALHSALIRQDLILSAVLEPVISRPIRAKSTNAARQQNYLIRKNERNQCSTATTFWAYPLIQHPKGGKNQGLPRTGGHHANTLTLSIVIFAAGPVLHLPGWTF